MYRICILKIHLSMIETEIFREISLKYNILCGSTDLRHYYFVTYIQIKCYKPGLQNS